MRRFVVLLATLFFSAAALASLSQGCYTGYAHHPDSGELAYTARYRPLDAEAKRWRVIYRDPDGEIIARKRMDFSHHRFVPVFELNILASGDMAGIRRNEDGDWRMVERKGDQDELVVEPFEPKPEMAADSGIHPFIKAHFDTLMAGEGLSFPFVLAPRQSVVDMSVARIEDGRVDGQRAVRFQASVDMMFVSWFTQDLVFAYDPDSKRLLSYRGLSNMQDADGEPYPVEVRYRAGDPPAGAKACDAARG